MDEIPKNNSLEELKERIEVIKILTDTVCLMLSNKGIEAEETVRSLIVEIRGGRFANLPILLKNQILDVTASMFQNIQKPVSPFPGGDKAVQYPVKDAFSIAVFSRN